MTISGQWIDPADLLKYWLTSELQLVNWNVGSSSAWDAVSNIEFSKILDNFPIFSFWIFWDSRSIRTFRINYIPLRIIYIDGQITMKMSDNPFGITVRIIGNSEYIPYYIESLPITCPISNFETCHGCKWWELYDGLWQQRWKSFNETECNMPQTMVPIQLNQDMFLKILFSIIRLHCLLDR